MIAIPRKDPGFLAYTLTPFCDGSFVSRTYNTLHNIEGNKKVCAESELKNINMNRLGLPNAMSTGNHFKVILLIPVAVKNE